MMVANITEKSLRLYNIPSQKLEEIKDAYRKREYLWLIKVWNDYGVTTKRLCCSCPDSVDIIKTFTPLLWQE